MTHEIQLFIFFVFGVVVEVLLNIKPFNKKNFLKFLLVLLLASLFVFYLEPRPFGGEFFFATFVFCIFFIIIASRFFKVNLLPAVNKYIILSAIILFWYIYINQFLVRDVYGWSIAFVFLIFTLMVIRSLVAPSLSDSKKVFLYVIFLISVVFILFVHILQSGLPTSQNTSMSKADAFFAGVIFMYFFVYLVYVFEFGMRKLDTFKKNKEYRAIFENEKKLIVKKFQNQDRGKKIIFGLLFLQAVSAVANSEFLIVSHVFFVGFWLIFFPAILFSFSKDIIKKDFEY